MLECECRSRCFEYASCSTQCPAGFTCCCAPKIERRAAISFIEALPNFGPPFADVVAAAQTPDPEPRARTVPLVGSRRHCTTSAREAASRVPFVATGRSTALYVLCVVVSYFTLASTLTLWYQATPLFKDYVAKTLRALYQIVPSLLFLCVASLDVYEWDFYDWCNAGAAIALSAIHCAVAFKVATMVREQKIQYAAKKIRKCVVPLVVLGRWTAQSQNVDELVAMQLVSHNTPVANGTPMHDYWVDFAATFVSSLAALVVPECEESAGTLVFLPLGVSWIVRVCALTFFTRSHAWRCPALGRVGVVAECFSLAGMTVSAFCVTMQVRDVYSRWLVGAWGAIALLKIALSTLSEQDLPSPLDRDLDLDFQRGLIVHVNHVLCDTADLKLEASKLLTSRCEEMK